MKNIKVKKTTLEGGRRIFSVEVGEMHIDSIKQYIEDFMDKIKQKKQL